jgi:PGF-CTERM protein
MIDNGHYGASIMNIDELTLSAYFEPTGCPVGQHEDPAGVCVDDDVTPGPDDCIMGEEIWDADSQSCIADPALSCATDEIWDYVVEACVDDGIITEGDCEDNETFQQDAAGVGECVETIIEPQDCPDGEILDPLTNTCVEDTTVVDEPDTAPTCNVFYWVGTTGNPTNNWNWTEMMSGWSEFNAPDNGEYTLALPKGDYFVYFGCWDAEGDTITLAVDGLPEIQEFEAEESWVWGWDEFSINDEDVGVQHDMVITWSSTDFGGTVTIHFKGVDNVADAIAESDTGGLPGFTASLGLMAMLGAALILARRKD